MSGCVLIVVDVQNDFLPGGALAAPDGCAVIAPINALAEDATRGINADGSMARAHPR